MDRAELAVAGDLNLAASWTALGTHARFAVTEVDSITMVASGLPIAYFNGGFVRTRTSDPAAAIASALRFFAGHRVPFLIWVRQGLDDDLVAAGQEAGLTVVVGPPSMALPHIEQAPHLPDELSMAIGRDRADIHDHRRLLGAAFEIPMDVADQIIGTGLIDDPNIVIAVGRVDGVPVVTALLCRSGETAGVYNVATLDRHRRKGYGAAATWAVIAEGARRGCTHSVLQSSPSGHPVYRAMGFEDVGTYLQLQGGSSVG